MTLRVKMEEGGMITKCDCHSCLDRCCRRKWKA